MIVYFSHFAVKVILEIITQILSLKYELRQKNTPLVNNVYLLFHPIPLYEQCLLD